MAARCETCHFWIPSRSYVEGGAESQQTGLCRFNPDMVRTASFHWCGKWQMPAPTGIASNVPAHAAASFERWGRDEQPDD